MLNHGALDLHVPLPMLRAQPLLTATVAWVLRVCLLDAMFDDQFEILQPFMRDGAHIALRFRVAAAVSAVACLQREPGCNDRATTRRSVSGGASP